MSEPTTNRERLPCKVCGKLPVMYAILPNRDPDTEYSETRQWVDTQRMPDDEWLNGQSIDMTRSYIMRCDCEDARYHSPALAFEAWLRSGPTVSNAWWQRLWENLNALSGDDPAKEKLYEETIELIASHIAANAPERPRGTPGLSYPEDDEVPHTPIGYVSESAVNMLRRGNKAFIRPEKDSLAKLPVYVGKPNVF